MAKTRAGNTGLIPIELIENKILLIRGKKVMLDRDLANLYGVKTGNLNTAVKRNIDRFPSDFMFQLTKDEFGLILQFATSKRGGVRKLPYAFTEQGVAMLSSVLKSKRAILVNILIIKTFVKLRELVSSQVSILRKIEEMEKKYDMQFKVVFDAIRKLMEPPPKKVEKIGFLR